MENWNRWYKEKIAFLAELQSSRYFSTNIRYDIIHYFHFYPIKKIIWQKINFACDQKQMIDNQLQ